ncbi:MAG: hypothetical protein K6G56_06690 [Clostridiales bacterium]|nr:hypothetical protein [Clostridiales bacterium]
MNRSLKTITAVFVLAAFIFSLLPAASFASGSQSNVTISVSPTELTQAGSVTVSITINNTNSATVRPTDTPAPTTAPPTDTPATPTPTAAPTHTPAPTATPEPTHTPPPAETRPPQTEEPTHEPSTPEPKPTDGEMSSGNYGVSVFSAARSSRYASVSASTYYNGEYSNITISNSYGVAFQTAGVIIPAGTSKTFTATMNVTDQMIGVDLPFTVTWYEGATPVSRTVTCKISRRSASPYLSVTRTATPVNASEGTEVTINYTFTNTGAVTLVNISLVDRNVAGTNRAIFSIASLEPGASREFVYTLTMGQSTIVSSPIVTFRAQGGSTELVNKVPTLTIGLIQSQLTKEIVKSDPTPEGVSFTIYLTNNGNQKLSSLMVTDELGAQLTSKPFSLAVGETKVIEYFVDNPTAVRYVVFNIVGEDYNGTEFRDNTSSYVVRPYIDFSLLGLSFTAVTASSLNQDNMIKIVFNVENTGSLEFFNLIVKEQSLGYELHKWPNLPVGASDKVEVEVNIGEVRDLVFILEAEDSSGNVHQHEAYVNAESIDVSGLVPTQNPADSDGEIGLAEEDPALGKKLDGIITSTGQKLMHWFRILGIIAACAALVMVILGIVEIIVRRNRRSRQS